MCRQGSVPGECLVYPRCPALGIDEEVFGTGVGGTKKDAEQQAAERAYAALTQEPSGSVPATATRTTG